jgi:hypothetical protein
MNGFQASREASDPKKFSISKHVIFYLFSILRVIFVFLDPDPRTRFNPYSRTQFNPNPNQCLKLIVESAWKYRRRLDGTLFILYILSLRIHNSFTAPSISLPEAEFIDPWLGDKVNSGIGLSYRPASPWSLSGRYNNPMQEVALSPQSGSMNSDTGNPKQTSCCCYAW